MKTKKTDKKMVLKKETISILNHNNLKAANGGGPTTVWSANTRCFTCAGLRIIC